MDKVEASVQHVSIFRIGNVYLIGVLYDFESDNQEGTLDVIVQGNSISFWIEEANSPQKGRTAMTTATVHIVSEAGPIPAFKVNKGKNQVITVPVFSPKAQDQFKIAGELIGFFASTGKTLSIIPTSSTGLPADIIKELGLEGAEVAVAREYGWNGW
jgi:hypothetical protein